MKPKKRKLTAMRCFKPNRSDELLAQIDRQVTQLLKATLELRKRDEEIETLRGLYQSSMSRNVDMITRINSVLHHATSELNGKRWVEAAKITEAIGQ